MTQECRTCLSSLPLEEFYKRPECRSGHSRECKRCTIRRTTSNRRIPQSKFSRRNHLLKTYGLTLAQYDAKLAAQGGVCSVCGGTKTAKGKSMPVDHDHACCSGARSCGECVRDILCDPCNKALGQVDDDPVRLRALADYVERFRGA